MQLARSTRFSRTRDPADLARPRGEATNLGLPHALSPLPLIAAWAVLGALLWRRVSPAKHVTGYARVVIDHDHLRGEVIRLVRAAAPWAPDVMSDDVVLGRDGLGFDSIRMVELLIACEDTFGVPFPTDLVTESLSIGALVEQLESGRAR